MEGFDNIDEPHVVQLETELVGFGKLEVDMTTLGSNLDCSLNLLDHSLVHLDHSLDHLDYSLDHLDRSLGRLDHSLGHSILDSSNSSLFEQFAPIYHFLGS